MSYANSENAVTQALVKLYKNYGYKLYKPSCFEEYSLYQENKDFLIGKNVITFSDMGGRLMALRPDVTLSLIKHSDLKPQSLEKYYYSEKVYRQTTGGKEFKEISQIGAEVIGNVDGASVCEMAMLICQTLGTINKEYVLDISHMGFTEALLKEFGDDRALVSEFLKSKNLHDFKKLSEKSDFPERLSQAFTTVLQAEGEPEAALKSARGAILNSEMEDALANLEKLCGRLKKFGYGDKIKIDFSVTNNADYYNGEVFNGYVSGVYHRVLSGGRYDKLTDKFGKSGGAIGFAVYLGELERFFDNEAEEVDYLILYNADTEVKALKEAEKNLKNGHSVRISNSEVSAVRYKTLIDLTDGNIEDD